MDPMSGATRADDVDPSEFARFYASLHPVVTRVAYLIVRSRAVAEELVHDAFTAVFDRWSTLANPGGYLRTTVVNAALKSKARDVREQRYVAALPPALTSEPEIDEMWDALGRLPRAQRAALVLRYYADATHAEIATALHCSVPTARSLTHRGIAALRKDLDRWTTR